MKLLDTYKIIAENMITPPNIPNTMNFWHGGNLDEFNDVISQKNGRYEYGPGLYITTHYDTARKYAKGGRKFYLITVANGTDINNAHLEMNAVMSFIQANVVGHLRKEILQRLEKFIKHDKVNAGIFNNIILNEKAIKSSNIKHLREFYIANGIDYEIVNNAFGWGEKMVVLYNMKKIVNIITIRPTDTLSTYEL